MPLDAQSDSSATAPESSSTPVPRPPAKRKSTPVLDDGPWTRVESRKRGVAQQQQPQPAASDAGITTSVTGTSSPVTERTEDEHALATEENRRTLAERLLPKPSERPPTLSSLPASLPRVLSRTPDGGIGRRVHQVRWSEKQIPDSYWVVSRTQFKLGGSHGKAWGKLYWKGACYI